MTRSNFGFTSDDFLSGQYDEYFQVMNQFKGGSYNKYTPINSHALSYNELDKIWQNPTFIHILSIWNANIGANGRKFVININENNNEITRKNKEKQSKKMYNFLYTKKKFRSIEKQIIATVAREGSCIIMEDSNGEQVVWSLRRFHVYHDDVTNTTRYAFLSGDGQEIAGLTNLQHGVDLWHIKDPVFEDWTVPPSRVDCAIAWILLQNNGLKSNNYIFSNAFIGTTLLGFSNESVGTAGAIAKENGVPDKQGRTNLQKLLYKINDTFRGVKKSFRVGSAFGLEKVFELGKSNQDIQFVELLMRSKAEIASAYGLTLSDLGDGDKGLTYNNASTFSYNVYGKIGHDFEEIIDEMTNDWYLPAYGISTTENYYFDYNKPSNPDRLALEEQARKNWESNLMTLNEARVVLDLEPDPDGDIYFSEFTATQNPEPEPIEVKPKEPEKIENGFFTKYTSKTKSPTELALESPLYLGDSKKKGFLNRWTEAITKQLTKYVSEFEKLDNEALNDYIVSLPKIETFYSFPALKKDLLVFAGLALDEVKKDKRTNFTLNFFDGGYPKVVLDNVDKFTEAVLKGNDLFDSIDVETTAQIQNIIKTNITSGVNEIAGILSAKIGDMAFNRAELIAQTAVAESVEKTREALYLIEFPDGSKEWITTLNDVCPLCIGNERQGKISIDKVFSSGVSAPSAHSRCRCSVTYAPAD